MPESSSSGSFYQKLSAVPLMSAERRQELLERFYALQLEMIDILVALMVPLYRYFARELETRNTELDTEEGAESSANARTSRLKAGQLKQIAKMLMELRQAHEQGDRATVELLQSQFRELMLGFDYALISTLTSSAFLQPTQPFLLDAPASEAAAQKLKDLTLEADELRDQLFKGNWRLVMEIARRFLAFGSKLDLDELIQEGNTGLLAAIDKFNPRLNLQLSTIAANWIQAKIRRALDNLSETIRTPVYKRQRKKLVQKAEMELLLEAQKKDDPATPQAQLTTGAEKLFGRSVDDKAIAERTGLEIEEVQELRRLYPETVSINAPVDGGSDGDEQERGELLSDSARDEEDEQDRADKKVFFELITQLVADLPLMHQVVLSGLNGLPIRKEVLKKLVHERADMLQRRGKALSRGVAICGKAAIQVFR